MKTTKQVNKMSDDSMLSLLTEEREMLSESIFFADKKSRVLTDLIDFMSEAYELADNVLEIEYKVSHGDGITEKDVVKASKLSSYIKLFVQDVLKNGF